MSRTQPWYAEPEQGVLYGVFDAAASEKVLPELSKAYPPALSLFEEKGEPTLTEVAPHIVTLDPKTAWARLVLERNWGHKWGIYLKAPVHQQRVRRQLRRLLKAKLPTGQEVMFRFYDPRILRVYLPTCLPEELEMFFGPIEAFYVFREEEPRVDAFTRSDEGDLIITTHEVDR